MNSNLEGRLRKYKLPKSKALLPLFEAIVNSIDSLIDEKQNEKYIKIYILRNDTLMSSTEKKLDLGEIYGFWIEDNGPGFNKRNFDAFKELDTLNKVAKGGKGIGRLAWLKAFDKINIISHYYDSDVLKQKSFKFHHSFEDGVEVENEAISSEHTTNTIIKLDGLKDNFLQHIPKRMESIGVKIIEHCLYYFTIGDIKFSIYDEQEDSPLLDLNKLFSEKYETKKSSLNVQDNDLNLIKVYSNISENKILYCANNRVVKEDKLAKFIPELKTSLPGEKYIQILVSGKVFDDTVNDERTDFDSNLFNDYNVDFGKLEQGIIEHIDKTLGDLILQQKEDNRNYLNEYVKKEAPQYTKIIRYATEEQIRKVHKDMKGDQIEQELFNIKQSLEKDIKSIAKDLSSLNEIDTKSLVEKVTALNSANLAEYVIYRKTIIDTLAKFLKIDDKSLEDDIHKLIYPMQTIETKDYSEHNLWLIDDRLAFHNFCASDVQFKKFLEDSKSADRPDILIFDKPFIYSPNKEYMSTMVLIEFKRPKRNDYSLGKDPISQVINYLDEISSNSRIIDNDNMAITINPNIQKQIFIIADLTSTFEVIIRKNYGWLMKASDGTGYFGYEPSSHSYIEIISYEKLLKDAKNRNRIFFDKLGI